jgi:hypothetical protein
MMAPSFWLLGKPPDKPLHRIVAPFPRFWQLQIPNATFASGDPPGQSHEKFMQGQEVELGSYRW